MCDRMTVPPDDRDRMRVKRRDMLLGAGAIACFGDVDSASAAGNDLQAILARWDDDDHRDLEGVVVRLHGQIVVERCYDGGSPDTLHDVRSVGKSVTSLLVGIAIGHGHIRSVSDTVDQYMPEMKGTAVGGVSLADILTMRSGLAADDDVPTSPGNEDRLMSAPDPIAFLKSVPQANRSGSTYIYSSLNAYVVGLIIARAVGETEAGFARKTLFEPLGINHVGWATDAIGNTRGQGNLSLTTRDLSLIGQMVLDQGRWKTRMVVNKDWIAESIGSHVDLDEIDRYADSYGYFWFTKTIMMGHEPILVHFASGNGGNKIYVVPGRHMVVAITSGAYDHRYGHERSWAILMALLSTR